MILNTTRRSGLNVGALGVSHKNVKGAPAKTVRTLGTSLSVAGTLRSAVKQQ